MSAKVNKMDDKQRAHYNDEQGKAFDKSYTYFLGTLPEDVIERMGRILAAAAIQEDETVLDVGTGTGALIPQIQGYHPGRIVACDLSGNMLEQVAERYPDVERHQCDIVDLSLAANSVDVVFMNGMYGNIADKTKALQNIFRMLRPSGRIIISHPEGRAYVEQLVKQDPYPITSLPTEDEAHAFLGSFGMTVRQYTDEKRLLIMVGVKE
jgi:ubiquinone/menaquinone biosynthesis C-methylase UbiE